MERIKSRNEREEDGEEKVVVSLRDSKGIHLGIISIINEKFSQRVRVAIVTDSRKIKITQTVQEKFHKVFMIG